MALLFAKCEYSVLKLVQLNFSIGTIFQICSQNRPFFIDYVVIFGNFYHRHRVV